MARYSASDYEEHRQIYPRPGRGYERATWGSGFPATSVVLPARPHPSPPPTGPNGGREPQINSTMWAPTTRCGGRGSQS
jgi:hypothetical protein